MRPERAVAKGNQVLKRLRHLRWKTPELERLARAGQRLQNRNFVRGADPDFRFESERVRMMKAGH
jgi:hypothetical protein